ncbi:DUF6343 family protein [Nonomuraea sp. NPDC050310]|uniref:DUF6343 family protein n=1 Tax=unclassified Nonomuraea TaxID=2593643 RepID=UPI0033EB5CF6
MRWNRLRTAFSPTEESPRSALGLRLVLAAFGVLAGGAAAVVAAGNGWTGLAWAMAAVAVIALVNLVVVLRRRRSG